jgi:hypothetical protein
MSASVKAGASVQLAQRVIATLSNRLGLPSSVLYPEPQLPPETGLADSGMLGPDLGNLLESFGKAVRATPAVAVLSVEDLEALSDEELRALVAALHRCVRLQVPICMVAAGTSSSPGRLSALAP